MLSVRAGRVPSRGMLSSLIVVIGLLPSPTALGQQSFVSRESINPPAELGSTLVVAQPGFFLPKQGSRATEGLEIHSVDPIILVGLVETSGWQAVLEDLSSKTIVFAHEGEVVLGYKVTRILPSSEAVFLEAAGEKIELRLGRYVAPIRGSDPITILSPPQRIEDLSRDLSSLGVQEQLRARQQIREYWQAEWNRGLGDYVSKLRPDDQVRIRAEISSYWRK